MVTLKRFIHIKGQITLNCVALICSFVYSFFNICLLFSFIFRLKNGRAHKAESHHRRG